MGGRRPGHGGREVHGQHPVPGGPQVPAHPAFAAADVHGQPAGGGDERQERVPVELPVAVVPRRPGPGGPGAGLFVPACPERTHPLILTGPEPGSNRIPAGALDRVGFFLRDDEEG